MPTCKRSSFGFDFIQQDREHGTIIRWITYTINSDLLFTKKRELKICEIFKVSIKEQFEHFPQWFCCVKSFTLGLRRGRFSLLKLFIGVLYISFLFQLDGRQTSSSAQPLDVTKYTKFYIVWAQINVRTVLTFNESNLVIRLWPHLQFISFPSSSHNLTSMAEKSPKMKMSPIQIYKFLISTHNIYTNNQLKYDII